MYLPRLVVRAAQDLVEGALDGRVRGRCAAASEALYLLAGGKDAGLVPMVSVYHVRGRRYSHWWLRQGHRVIDPTAAQFSLAFRRRLYARGRGCGFQATRANGGMSRAARELLIACSQAS